MIKKRVFDNPKGTRDFLPPEMIVRNHVQAVIKGVFEIFGYQCVQTPSYEEFALLAARSGDEIREAMFTFESERQEYALRPEMTAPVCRMVGAGKLNDFPLPYKLYYIGQCFRYTRPGTALYREFTQAGVELLGPGGAAADAEVIAAAIHILKSLGIGDYQLQVGNIGILRELVSAQNLYEDQQRRLIGNIYSIHNIYEKCEEVLAKKDLQSEDFDSFHDEVADLYQLQREIGYEGDLQVVPGDSNDENELREMARKLPDAADATYRYMWADMELISAETADLLLKIIKLKGDPKETADKALKLLKGTAAEKPLDDLLSVWEWLDQFDVGSFQLVPCMVRGLDFYTGTVFQIHSSLSGSRRQLCGGGRYDDLVAEFGGPRIPATGFAYGIDRLVELFLESDGEFDESLADVTLVASGSEALFNAAKIANLLRSEDIRTIYPLLRSETADQLQYAAKIKSKFAVLVEKEGEAVTLKEMATGKEETIPVSGLAEKIKAAI